MRKQDGHIFSAEGELLEIITRMGDGRRIYMTRQQVFEDIEAGMSDGADAAEVPSLSDDEMEHIVDIIGEKDKNVAVEPGEEVVLTNDGGQIKITMDNGGSGVGIDMGRLEAILLHERAFAHDTFELAWTDYSLKAVKPIIANEMQAMEYINSLSIVPLLYGAMPNMGLYYAPDGPYGNPTDLMREFKIEEAMEQAEAAAEHLARDIGYVTTLLDSAGGEGYNFDTTASAGDAEFVGTLMGVQAYRKACPHAYIAVGMAAETVLGIHGSIEYDGEVVAGMFPHNQAKMVAKAGANNFGAVVNTNTSKSFAWNVARSATMVKECVRQSDIPVHADLGMGVGGVPMCEVPPTDCVTRAGKILIEVANIDGI